MSLQNISFCRYLTKFSDPWLDDHYRARAIVRAIKGEPFKGDARFRINGSIKTLDSKNPDVAIQWFVEQVATGIAFTGTTFLCPIPGSGFTPTSIEPSRTLLLAQRLVERNPKLTLWPNLKFKQPMEKKIRSEERLLANLVCTVPIPKGDFLLLDDVCTTGAHARAARRKLMELGAKGEIVSMSVARTMLVYGEKVFGYRIDSL
jgi:hypothetical protein